MATLLLFDSLHFVFARLLLPVIEPQASALYVMAISVLEVGIFGIATRRLHWTTGRRYIWFFAAIGALVAVNMSIHYEAVALIDPGMASLLNQSAVLFNLAFGILWLRDRLAPLQGIGALIALAGVITISFQPGDYLRLGALLVVIAALMYAAHNALTKRYGGEIAFLDFFFFRLLATATSLMLITVGRSALVWPTPKAWGLMLLVATVDIVLSRTLYYLALRRLSISTHTIALTLSPVAAAIWAFVIFGSEPGVQQVLGGLAILIGVAIVSLGRPSNR